MAPAPLPHLADMARRIARREVSATELTRTALQNIVALDPQLNAFISVFPEQALASAAQMDLELARGVSRGPLHGVPLSVKDLFWIAGSRTTAGSRVLRDFVPTQDAAVVRRVRAAGGVILGKTNMLEFAYASPHPDYGPTANPWNTAKTAAGSSGGSGASVAAGLDFGSFGSDTGGSIRVPSSFCGATGLKPSYGRVSRSGMIPLSPTLDHAGPIGRSVEDVALLLQAIAGPDESRPDDHSVLPRDVPDFTAALSPALDGLSIGVLEEFDHPRLDPEVRIAFRAALHVFEAAGARTEALSIPELGDAALAAYMPILYAEASHCHRAWLRDRRDDYSAGALERLDAGTRFSAVDYLAALEERDRIRARVAQSMLAVDLLALPTMAMPAWDLDATDIPVTSGEQDLLAVIRHTAPFDLTGQPALSMPCGSTGAGLPVGLQLIARDFEEPTLLRAGAAFQARTQWHRGVPRVSATWPID